MEDDVGGNAALPGGFEPHGAEALEQIAIDVLPRFGLGARPHAGEVLSVAKYGDAAFYFQDQTYAEPNGFWTAGQRTSDITVAVPPERAPSMIDEYPVLAIAAAFASGTTRMRGLGELRVKESDRLAAIARGLAACGAKVEIAGDDLIVHGTGRPPEGGSTIAVALDHRIAMSFLVLGMASQKSVAIDDEEAIGTSFPGFRELMNGLGGTIS